ncbi:MAG: hypothetical protein K2F79_04860, partial [Muribaculaceae bacterium]|nr:hypothetical protein [Muribaculaceae bacterium]
ILRQDNKSETAILDGNGEMRFNTELFSEGKDMTLSLYSTRRSFPEIRFAFDNDEKEYEFIETGDPTPWWKIAGEIALAFGGAFMLYAFYHVATGFFRSLPDFFA